MRRSSHATPRSRPSTRSRASTACAPSPPTPDASRALLEETLGFAPTGEHAWEARGAVRGGRYAYDPPPASGAGIPGAGTVHHVAWASNMDEQEAWLDAGSRRGRPSERDHRPLLVPLDLLPRAERGAVRDRHLGPGFSIDEDADHLGEALILPPAFEHLRSQIEPVLTPLPDPRAAWTEA